VFHLDFTAEAESQLIELRDSPALAKRYKAVSKALRLLASNPRHHGLNTHVWDSRKCSHGDKLFEAYAENNTPAAYRIFWCYAPGGTALLIDSVTAHPRY
jgi:hypothetical protein